MARPVVAVMDSMDQKDDVFGELLRDKGYKENDIKIISQDDEEAKHYTRYFEQGNFVVTVDVEKDIGQKHKTDPGENLRKADPLARQEHPPHHHMKRGL
ncbi:hypothetical protein CR205_12530 [Alteribacter lacisalsi]|uniref:Uncharacterized protein n=1 Tax=Alteribacter lacisalsi TaxID=2045244 RepID=A0A2W0H3Y0_9BACI|nr:hypothetical protein [Alteribacter lacisalsi]PYZ96534.1 hypothetical protein CR205_12530 [Alteribacter lacisalsi]